MIIVLLGASGTGKSTIERTLVEHYKFKKIVPYTTRQPRNREMHGKDYYFTDNNTFTTMINAGVFAEYEEYSQKRRYGTIKSDYFDEEDKVVVLTPNGLRQLKQNCSNIDIFTILINASLGTRVKRYINRCGVDKFNYDDKNEIAMRVERDCAMFLGIEKEVDLVLHNDEGTSMEYLINEILDNIH